MMENKKHPGGRPSGYKKEYCQRLIDHMAEGLSFEAFAGAIDSCKQTLYSWSEKFPEFMDAKKRGEAKSLLFWEKLGRAGAAGKVPGFNTGSWVFNMKNRFKWRDAQDIEVNFPKPMIIKRLDGSEVILGFKENTDD